MNRLTIHEIEGVNITELGYVPCKDYCKTHECNDCAIQRVMDKLAHYEDLEDKVCETLQEGGTIETIVDYFLTNFTSIAGKVERACVLTNEDYDKWKRWKTLDEQGKLVEVAYGFNKSDYPSEFECSVCGFSDWDTYTADDGAYKYCPRCGAKMKGGAE